MSALNATRRIWPAGLALLCAIVAVAGGRPWPRPAGLSLSELSVSELSQTALSLSELSLPILNLYELSHLALIGYGNGTVFGTAGGGDGQLSSPSGVGVDDTSGDLYVVDSGNKRVQKFDSEGKYILQFNGSDNPSSPSGFNEPNAIAVDNSAGLSKGDVYVVDAGDNAIAKFSSAGAFLFELKGFTSAVIGATVDSLGNLWVAEKSGSVQEFDGAAENQFTRSLSPEFGREPGIAVDSKEDIYLVRGEPFVAKFDGSGQTLKESVTACGCDTALAIEPGTDDLFVDQGNSLAKYGPFGEPYQSPLETFGSSISSSHGIAVDGATHTVYASEREADAVAIFKLVLLPDVTTGSASEVERTSAKLNGEVNPDGQAVTSCLIEYGTSTAYGQTLPCTPAPGSGSSPVAVSAETIGLAPETTYHYRLVASNANGVNTGVDQTFITPVAVEGVETEAATEVLATSAKFNGSLEPNGFDTHYSFEYGPAGSLGSSTADEDAGSATEDKHISAAIGGLRPHETYNYRLVAENSFGRTLGAEDTFSTPVIPPQISGQPSASFVTAQSVVLNASLNPEHTSTLYRFEYGACPAVAGCATLQSTPAEESSVYGTIGSTREIVGLTPSTTYSYRLVADNEFEEEPGKTVGGKASGLEGTFTTGPAPAPSTETGFASAVTPTSAVISGLVNPDGLPATYAFEVGVYAGAGTQYGVIFSGSAGSSLTPIEEVLPLSGLQPGTTYAFRITISSGYIAGETHTLQGAMATFTTGGLPSVLVVPPVFAQLPIPNIPFPKASGPAPKKKKSKAAPKKRKKGKSGKGKRALRGGAHKSKTRTRSKK